MKSEIQFALPGIESTITKSSGSITRRTTCAAHRILLTHAHTPTSWFTPQTTTRLTKDIPTGTPVSSASIMSGSLAAPRLVLDPQRLSRRLNSSGYAGSLSTHQHLADFELADSIDYNSRTARSLSMRRLGSLAQTTSFGQHISLVHMHMDAPMNSSPLPLPGKTQSVMRIGYITTSICEYISI